MAADEIWPDPIPTTGFGFTIADPTKLLMLDNVPVVDLGITVAGSIPGPPPIQGEGEVVCEDDRPETGMLYPRG